MTSGKPLIMMTRLGVAYPKRKNEAFGEFDKTMLKYVRSMGFSGVTFQYRGVYQIDLDANSFFVDPEQSLSRENLALLVKEAQRLKLRVALRPVVGLMRNEDYWRGNANPSIPGIWIGNVADYVCDEARFFKRLGVEDVCAGSEYKTVCDPNHPKLDEINAAFMDFFKDLRAVFRHGNISYCLNHDRVRPGVADKLTFLRSPDLDAVGVSAYFKGQGDTAAKIAESLAGRIEDLNSLSEATGHDIEVSEFGCKSAEGNKAQRNYIEGFLMAALNIKNLTRANLWMSNGDHDPSYGTIGGEQSEYEKKEWSIAGKDAETFLRGYLHNHTFLDD